MCPLSLCDILEVELRDEEGVRLHCSDESLPPGEDNLVIQAVRAFERRSECRVDAEIYLTKKIPSGAGLGGGSSDAASTLMALDALYETRLGAEELARVAAEVGSDAPFFIYEGVCDCRGHGEMASPVAFDWELPIVLIKPPFAVDTPWAYSQWEGAVEVPGVCYVPQICYWGPMVNDLERPVFAKYLLLPQLKMWLLEQEETHAALLSGSGSTVLVVLSSEHGGERLAEKVRATYGESMWTFVGHTLSS